MPKNLKKIVAPQLDYLILTLAVVASVALMFLGNRGGELGALQGVSLELLGRMTGPVAAIKRLGDVYEENSRLRYQNAMLQVRNCQLAEAHYENQRLRAMVGFAEQSTARLQPARLIGSGSHPGMATILIDAGRLQGIEENRPVISADGLVGKVISVSSHHSIIQLLTDRNFRVAALDQRSRVQGVFQWAGFDSGLLTGVFLSADVKLGDWVVTSGQNSLFPTGLKIGVVSMIDDAHAGMFQKIYVKPRLDFSRLEEVFVILDADSSRQAGG